VRRPALVALLCAPLLSCAAESSAGDAITLRFWGMGREGEVVAEMMDGFHRENPQIRVQVQQIPWTAAHEKLLTAYVGNAVPDVAQLGNTWVPEFAAIRALLPLDSLIDTTASLAPADYFPGIWRTNLVGDTTWGVPWYVDTRVIFYRTDLLRAAGYDDIPDTWSGWVDAMRAVKRLDPTRYAIFLPTNEWAQPALLGLQNGSTLLNEEGTRGAFAEPAFREAFEFYLSLFREGSRRPWGITTSRIRTRSSAAASSPCGSRDRGTSASSGGGSPPTCRIAGPRRRCRVRAAPGAECRWPVARASSCSAARVIPTPRGSSSSICRGRSSSSASTS
jgi:ABC-type glycerol-3-phosphate transport system substrate-binding protein